MSRTLPSGLYVKTGYHPGEIFPDQEPEERHYVELGDSPEVKMTEAVKAIRFAFADPELANDATLNQYRKFLKSFYPRSLDERDGVRPPIVRYIPAMEGFRMDYPENPGPIVEVLGRRLTRNDLIAFTDYVFSNSQPEGPDDPRTIFLDELRGDGKESQAVTETPTVDQRLYKMIVDGEEHWVPLRQAGVLYDFGFAPVSIGGLVLDGIGRPRQITNKERAQIADIADEWSAGK